MNITGIKESDMEGLQPEAHLSLVGTSSDSEIPIEFIRVERKRKPSPGPFPPPKKTRTTRQKQQEVRPPTKKMTPRKRKERQVIPPLDNLLNEITDDGNLSNVSKLYDTFTNEEKESIENSIILHLDIYKKVLIEVVDDLPSDLYRRLDAKRLAIMELDKKIKIEKLLVFHPVKSVEEIDELISEANRTVFSSRHRHVILMVGKVNEISKETAGKWDIFFVEKEKQEELKRPKIFKVYQKDKDKGKGKVGRLPNIKVTDNLPPPLVTPSVLTNNTPATENVETPHEDTNRESEILYTMNIDTQEVNIVVDKESTEEKKKDVATEQPTDNVGTQAENVEVETPAN